MPRSSVEDELPTSAEITSDDERLGAAAFCILRLRQLRSEYFKTAIFGEPAWEMLLALFIDSFCGVAPSDASICARSGVPSTTALRWLEYLQQQQLVVKDAHQEVNVRLSDKGLETVRGFLEAALENGLSKPPPKSNPGPRS
jgi:hypothetical protein